ncbi:MAG: peptide-methionine (S)-S-oxide reductase MsrA [Pseudomonadota bacterium]
MFGSKPLQLPTAADALAGREVAIAVAEKHFVHGTSMTGPFEAHLQKAVFAGGCFWGVERIFWQLAGVHSTSVGYAGGITPNPTYEEVCSGRTGHTEVVQVVFDPARISFEALLKAFWEGHDPTQGMRQGNDRGTQYRSAIYTYSDEQQAQAETSRQHYQRTLSTAGYPEITTEIAPLAAYYFAEDAHQQYLAKNPGGYCGIGGTGVSCPIGLADTANG